jgi:hypothetical protein
MASRKAEINKDKKQFNFQAVKWQTAPDRSPL